jgi:hypothetical protein
MYRLFELQSLVTRKLGICRKCFYIAAAGTIISWTLYLTIELLFPVFLRLLFIVAIAFSVAWVSHLAAYYIRVFLPLSKARKSLGERGVELSVTSLEPEKVTGAITVGDIGLRFESAFADNTVSLSIRDLQNRSLLVVQERAGTSERSILDGRLHMALPVLDFSDDMSEREIAALTEKMLAEMSVEGEESVFDELQALPEFRLLPVLSKALGKLGVSGSRYQATLPLHVWAMGAYRWQQSHPDGELPPGREPDVVYRIKHPFQDQLTVPNFADFFYDDVVPCGGTHFGDHIFIYPPGYDEPWDPGCQHDCERFPNRDNGCFGMCGPGCTCWSAICLDCCYHPGCAIHDTWCRKCEAGSTKHCLLCYSPPALIGFWC